MTTKTNKRTKSGPNYARLLGAAAIVCVVAVAIAALIGAGGEGGAYYVRAEFKNSSQVNEDSDVRIAGATVGLVEDIFLTERKKASFVLRINDPAFQRFYADAKCRIRLQSLIGEKFVDCDPGTPTKDELPVDPYDDGRRVLKSDRTSAPVDIDTILNNMREPERERFRVIMSELGITLAGRGQDLNEILMRFNDTFKEVVDVLKILARQNEDLEQMAVDGEKILTELAANREHITNLFDEADQVQRAVNVRRSELAATWEKLPAFLDELEPMAKELNNFAKQSAPIARAARFAGKDLSTWITGTADFAEAANGGLTRFGGSLDVLREKIPVLMPIAEDLNRFAQNRSAVTNIRKLLESFEKQGGYENLASAAIGLVGAANGFDAFGHFMRSGLIVGGDCFEYVNPNVSGAGTAGTSCSASYATDRGDKNKEPSAVSAEASASRSPEAAGLDYLLGGER